MYKILSPFRILLWAVWSICCILFSFLVYAVTLKKENTVWFCKHLWAPMSTIIPGVKLNITSNNKINFNNPHVYISNHQSFLDIPIIVRAVNALIYFVAKKELKKLPFLGWYITISGMIFVDRSNRTKAIESMKNAAKMVKAGKNVLTFPEGTRSKNGNLLPFKKGAFLLAIDAEVPIVPIVIAGSGKIFPSNKIIFKPGPASVKLLDPIDTASYKKENVDDLINLCQNLIETEKELLEKSLQNS